MKVSQENYHFVLEHIHDASGALLACELLTRFNPSNDESMGAATFMTQPVNRRIALFEEQLEIVSEIVDGNPPPHLVSINIDAEIAEHFLSQTRLLRRIRELDCLRFEVSEEFSHLNNHSGAKMLERIALHCPLWLDDFGSGNSNLNTVIDGNFEYVKIDKRFFWRYGESHTFGKLIDYILPYCKGIIVAGVVNVEHKKLLLPLDISGVQGVTSKRVNIHAFG